MQNAKQDKSIGKGTTLELLSVIAVGTNSSLHPPTPSDLGASSGQDE